MDDTTYEKVIGLINASNDSEALSICEEILEKNPLDDRALCLRGDLFFIGEEYENAFDCYKTAYRENVICFVAIKGMAQSLFAMKKYHEAIEFYEKSLDFNHKDGFLLAEYGQCLLEIKQYKKSVAVFKEALPYIEDKRPIYCSQIVAMLNYASNDELEAIYDEVISIYPNEQNILASYAGFLWEKKEDFTKAFNFYIRAIDINPNDNFTNISLANMIYQNSVKDAILGADLAKKWYALYPMNSVAIHTYQAISGKTAEINKNADYVERLFDNFSATFDEVLTSIEYDTPKKIGRILNEVIKPEMDSLDILDAGCGTGMCGEYLRPFAKNAIGLTGVDLSEKMLEEAVKKGLYNYLLKSDIAKFMNGIKAGFDLIVSADVFIYIGDLKEVIKSAFFSLKDEGIFIFSVSLTNKKDFILDKSGRYFHNIDYVKNILLENSFSVEYAENDAIRMEFGKPENGMIIVARKPKSLRSFL